MTSPKYLAGILAAVYVLFWPGGCSPLPVTVVNEGLKGILNPTNIISNPSGDCLKNLGGGFAPQYVCIHVYVYTYYIYMYTEPYIIIYRYEDYLGPQPPPEKMTS